MLDGKECLTLANVNELLIKEGHAVEYDGGKR
jgi:endonuclease YncB( thermonuclease family)